MCTFCQLSYHRYYCSCNFFHFIVCTTYRCNFCTSCIISDCLFLILCGPIIKCLGKLFQSHLSPKREVPALNSTPISLLRVFKKKLNGANIPKFWRTNQPNRTDLTDLFIFVVHRGNEFLTFHSESQVNHDISCSMSLLVNILFHISNVFLSKKTTHLHEPLGRTF